MTIAENIAKQYYNSNSIVSDQFLCRVDYYIDMCTTMSSEYIKDHNWYITKDGVEEDYDYYLFKFNDSSVLYLGYGMSSHDGTFETCQVVEVNIDGWERNGSYGCE